MNTCICPEERQVCPNCETEKYIADYENWHFESYWNEYTESWSVYQAEKTENGYELRCHCFQDNPVKTTEDAKERVENWLKLLPILKKASDDHERKADV